MHHHATRPLRPPPLGLALAVSVALAGMVSPADAMKKAELIHHLANGAGISHEDAADILDAFINNTTLPKTVGDRSVVVGFGTFSAARHSSFADPKGASGQKGTKRKISYRGSRSRAGVMTDGPNGTIEFEVTIPDASFFDQPLEMEVKLPKKLGIRIVELLIDAPDDEKYGGVLSVAEGYPAVLEISLPSNLFDDPDLGTPTTDFHGPFASAFHEGLGTDPCTEAVLSAQLGFGGEPLCPATGCIVTAGDRAALEADLAAESGVTAEEASRALDLILALPFGGGPSVSESASGFGSFTVKKHQERAGRNPQTGQAIKIAAKVSVRFKPGKALKDAVN